MINKIEISNFTVFKNVAIDFCGGINVIIGENGSGKTHLLKFLYGLYAGGNKSRPVVASLLGADSSEAIIAHERVSMFMECFRPRHFYDLLCFNGNMQNLMIYSVLPSKAEIILSCDGFTHRIYDAFDVPEADKHSLVSALDHRVEAQSVFIPATEMLSHARGFMQLYNEKEIAYDKTHYDIINSSLRVFDKKPNDLFISVTEKLSEVIGGKVEVKGDEFYLRKTNGQSVPFSMEAEGLRKLGALWTLLRNSSINSGTVLLWDEPEANLNPQLFSGLVDVLLELTRNGVQIFLATHSYDLAKFIDIKQQKSDNVLFHSLYKTADGAKCETTDGYQKLQNNAIENGATELYNAVVAQNIAVISNEA